MMSRKILMALVALSAITISFAHGSDIHDTLLEAMAHNLDMTGAELAGYILFSVEMLLIFVLLIVIQASRTQRWHTPVIGRAKKPAKRPRKRRHR